MTCTFCGFSPAIDIWIIKDLTNDRQDNNGKGPSWIPMLDSDPQKMVGLLFSIPYKKIIQTTAAQWDSEIKINSQNSN